jgi:hypothetical protein
VAVIAVAADDPFVGTWKMNPAKSKSSYPLGKSKTITSTAQGNVQNNVSDTVDADGKTTHRSWTSIFDGKDHPLAGDPNADMTSETRVNPNTIRYVFKKNGKEVYSGQATVSKDGKTMTDVGGGTLNGKAFTYSIFMEKQ